MDKKFPAPVWYNQPFGQEAGEVAVVQEFVSLSKLPFVIRLTKTAPVVKDPLYCAVMLLFAES